MASALPVFLKERDIPPGDEDRYRLTVEISTSAEAVSGKGTIVGAQLMRGGLWRIYPKTKDARNSLLIRGFNLRGVSIKVSEMNPYSMFDDDGNDQPTTKVWIDNVPISVDDAEIEHSLSAVGCELRGSIRKEMARNKDGKMTRFMTGRRFVLITVPHAPLEKTLKVSIFTASIYHREQKFARKQIVCSRCLESGHHVSVCENDIVCRICRKPGHKRGDPECTGIVVTPSYSAVVAFGQSASGGGGEGEGEGDKAIDLSVSSGGEGGGSGRSPRSPQRRGSLARLSQNRQRSLSLKRNRPNDSDSPTNSRADKQPRVGEQPNPSSSSPASPGNDNSMTIPDSQQSVSNEDDVVK